MRYKKHRYQSQSGLLASKRITVALCAAIAMVLGAMSVGATMHINTPLEQLTGANQSDTSSYSNSSNTGQAPSTKRSIPDYTYPSQQLLTAAAVPTAPTQQPVLHKKGTSKSKPLANVNLGPLTALVESKQIKLDVKLPVETPIIPPTTTVTVPLPLPEVTEPEPETTPPPADPETETPGQQQATLSAPNTTQE